MEVPLSMDDKLREKVHQRRPTFHQSQDFFLHSLFILNQLSNKIPTTNIINHTGSSK